MKTGILLYGSLLILLLYAIYYVFKRFALPRILEKIGKEKSLPFFPNGLATTLKESRHLRRSINETFSNFFISKPGSGYLGDYLSNKKDWPVESAKWFLIDNPGTPAVVDILAEKLKNYGVYSVILSDEDKQQLLEHKGFTIAENMTDWQKFCWKYNIYWYGSLSGQERISYKRISFATRAERGNDIVWHQNELSPYYFGSNVEYGFQVTDQEDVDNVRLKVTFTITGKNINPHVSDVDNANVFERMYSMVESKAGDVVKSHSFHLLHEKVKALADKMVGDHRDKMKQNVSDIREGFQSEIINMLNNPDNFIGFEWQPDSVNILQIEVVGDESISLLKKIIEALQIQIDNQNAIETNIANNTIAENTAETAKKVAITKSEGEKTVLENTAQGKANALKIETDAARKAIAKFNNEDATKKLAELQAAVISGINPEIILTGDALGKLKLGGLAINNLNVNDLIKLFTEKTTTT